MAWYRIRYDDQGSGMEAALRHLDVLATQGHFEMLWLVRRRNPVLLMRTSDAHEALLVEGLHNTLPGARLARERSASLDGLLGDLPRRVTLTGEVPPAPVFPELLLQLETDAAIHLTWDGGVLAPPVLNMRETHDIKPALARCWPTGKVPLISLGGRKAIAPTQLIFLPPASEYPTLASRNTQELAFKDAHTSGFLLGQDISGRPVGLPRPMRALWIGAPSRVDNVAAWFTQRWAGRVLVLDASGVVEKGWQDVSGADVFISWNLPGKSSHVNPLQRLPDDTLDSYVARVMAWLSSLNINAALLGSRVVLLVQAALKLLVATGLELHPPQILAFLNHPEITNEYDSLAGEVLNSQEFPVWRSRDWRRDQTWLQAAVATLRAIFDATPEMALWFPPYIDGQVLLESKWSLIRVATATNGQRAFWGGMWPLLRQVYARPDVLTLGLEINTSGRPALALAEGGASVLLWGRSVTEAVGTDLARLGGTLDLVVGAGADPAYFGKQLQVPPQILAAQAEDQALVRIGTDVGSVRFRLPERAMTQQRGWLTASGVTTPPLLSVLGDTNPAQQATLDLILRALSSGSRVLILGRRDLWPALREFVPEVMCIPAEDLPMLNPLAPKPANAYPWVWWAQGLGIPAVVMQGAYRDGRQTLQSLLDYLGQVGNYAEIRTVLREAVVSGMFGEAESDPREWFNLARIIAVEAITPAIVRTLAMAAFDAQARLVLWNAPGIAESDHAFLARAHALVYPDVLWSPDVLVTRVSNGLLAVLPERLQTAVPQLSAHEAYLYRRGAGSFSKVVLQDAE